MAGTERHELVEAARLRAELTVSELWLRYVALGGNGDLFDVDAYLSGLLPLGAFDQNVLAVAVNERLEEVYRAARVPLATPARDPDTEELRAGIAALLDSPGPHPTAAPPSSNDPPPAPDPRTASHEDPGGTA